MRFAAGSLSATGRSSRDFGFAGKRPRSLRPDSVLEFSKQMSGIDDRDARNRSTMSATLERVAAAVEG